MSFEFHSGIIALNLLHEFGASRSQAESVCEAIIPHADLGDTGMITNLGQLIQLSTLFGELLFTLRSQCSQYHPVLGMSGRW